MNYVLNEEKMFADVTDGIAIIINSETLYFYQYPSKDLIYRKANL